jgi:hypothetical protein
MLDELLHPTASPCGACGSQQPAPPLVSIRTFDREHAGLTFTEAMRHVNRPAAGQPTAGCGSTTLVGVMSTWVGANGCLRHRAGAEDVARRNGRPLSTPRR